jgi:hypothetical protein
MQAFVQARNAASSRLRRLTVVRGIAAAAADLQQPAHQRYRELF